MTTEQKSRLLEIWSTYFPGAELPVAFFRSDEAHGASPSRHAKGWRCFIGDLAAVRRVGPEEGDRELGAGKVRGPDL